MLAFIFYFWFLLVRIAVAYRSCLLLGGVVDISEARKKYMHESAEPLVVYFSVISCMFVYSKLIFLFQFYYLLICILSFPSALRMGTFYLLLFFKSSKKIR